MTPRRIRTMTRPLTLHFYEDPGHGWLKVPVKLLEELQLVDKISHYSYLLGQHAYLEEDCDVGVLAKALEDARRPFTVVRHFSNNPSTIRGYPSFSRQMAANMAKVPVAGMRLVYGDLRLTLMRAGTRGSWEVSNHHGQTYRMSRRQVMEATVPREST